MPATMNFSTQKRPVGVFGLFCSHAPQNGVSDTKVCVGQIGAPSAAKLNSGAPSIYLSNELEDEYSVSPRISSDRKEQGYDSGFQSSDDDGSLPTSPDSQPSSLEFPITETELQRETRELIGAFYRRHTGLSRSEKCRHKALGTLTKVTNDVLIKHEITFKGMLTRLDMDKVENGIVRSVAESTFNDGITNWGRIASLVAFGAVVSKHLKEAGRSECVEIVTDQISSYLAKDQYDWFQKNNEWLGFVDFFHTEDPESLVRNALIAVAGFAGLSAGLAFLIR